MQTKKIELDRLKADNSVKLREVFELEKSIQLTGRDMSYLSEAESRQKLELDQCTQKLKVCGVVVVWSGGVVVVVCGLWNNAAATVSSSPQEHMSLLDFNAGWLASCLFMCFLLVLVF